MIQYVTEQINKLNTLTSQLSCLSMVSPLGYVGDTNFFFPESMYFPPKAQADLDS